MSFLDRLSKAVTETVDRGKREVDQFMRIQKINGEIGEIEKKIAEMGAQIQGIKVQIGEKAVEMLRAGTLQNPDLQALVDQIVGIEQEIANQQAQIAEKKAAIEAIKAEDEAQAKAQAQAPAAAGSQAAPAAGARFCPQCGAQVPEGAAFCAQCGAKLG